ncbi:hypothetical protein FGE12_08625 [Aggregicoccus sp. 17bor-14]|uniref:outer membrane beta-barrel protein n=1 Tax=Myxococcaceae TaxID=31 RepID=UPI00129C673F|nr:MULTISPECIES: outer membrane beta-barrel protein [Myxococcaceae]MBF5042463.1 outer membrane beta-barrel protein [Simulacricoccus sp. 17bor-14]MRI88234.1 hypothetical protein [Aggregicoccus sp. 17bor-14]
MRTAWMLGLGLGLFVAAAAGAQQMPPTALGLRLNLSAGVEVYTGELGNAYTVGPAGGVSLSMQPLPFLGAEVGYVAGLHQVDSTLNDGGLVKGYDIVHHGLHLAATLGPWLHGVRPYALAGGGVSLTDVRGPKNPDFRDDVDFFVPVGAGLMVSAGRFALDARLSYQFLFDQESVSAPDGNGGASGGRYQAMVGLSFAL